MERTWKYDAFISYRHLEWDKQIAVKLQKMLERYHPPRQIRPDHFKGWHIFRDETELTTSSDLSEEIKKALKQSRFLIVICSEETSLSPWCVQEIQYFKKLNQGSNSRIIPLVISGNPPAVFPEELCREVILVQTGEKTVQQERKTEPLAANITAESRKKSLRRLKTEFLRIAAPMLGCGYDALYQRAQKQKICRIFSAGGTTAALIFLFGLYSSAMLLQISRQKEQLEIVNLGLEEKTAALDLSNKELLKSNLELELKTEEAEKNLLEAMKQRQIAEENLAALKEQKQIAEDNLEEANRQRELADLNAEDARNQKELAEASAEVARIQKNLAELHAQAEEEQKKLALASEEKAQIESSRTLAYLSEAYREKGDNLAAAETALSALPADGERRPVLPEVECVLSNEIGAYEQKSFLPIFKLCHDEPVSEIFYAGQGSSIVTRSGDTLILWDSKTGVRKKTIMLESTDRIIYDHTNVLQNTDLLKYAAGVFIRDETGLWGYEKTNDNEICLSDGDFYIQKLSRTIKCDGKTGKVLWERKGRFTLTEEQIVYQDISHQGIVLYDKKTGQKTASYSFGRDVPIKAVLHGSWTGFTNSHAYRKYFTDSGEILIAMDIADGILSHPRIIQQIDSEKYLFEVPKAFMVGENLLTLHHQGKLLYYYDSVLSIYDSKTASLKAQITIPDTSLSSYTAGQIDAAEAGNYCDMLFIAVGNKLILIDSRDGSVFWQYVLNGNAVKVYYARNGMIYIITDQGYEIAVPVMNISGPDSRIEGYIGKIVTHTFGLKPEQCGYYNHQYAAVERESSDVQIFSDIINPDFTEIYHNPYPNSNNSQMTLNASGTYGCIEVFTGEESYPEEIVIYDAEQNQTYSLLKSSDYIQETGFMGENRLAVLTGRSIKIYDLPSRKQIGSYQLTHWISDMLITPNKIVIPLYNRLIVADETNISEWIPQGEDAKITANWESGQGQLLLSVTDRQGSRLELFDTETGNAQILWSSPAEDWLDFRIVDAAFHQNKISVVCSNKMLYIFDTAGKNKPQKISLPVLPVSAAALGKNQTAVLGKDAVLYRINIQTGKVQDTLQLPSHQVKDILEQKPVYRYLSKKNLLILNWKNQQDAAYLIDLKRFAIRYQFPFYADFDSRGERIAINRYGVSGFFPNYTTEELRQKAESYLKFNDTSGRAG